MQAGGSKQKGATFERDVCKRLSLWASNGLREDLYWRSSMSGGRATIQIRQGIQNKSQAGDISSIDRQGSELVNRFCIECKHYGNLDLISGIIKNKGVLYSFWNKLTRDANAIGKLPFLLAKQNHLPSLVLVTPAGALTLNLKKNIAIATLYRWNAILYNGDDFLRSDYPFGEAHAARPT